MAGNELYYGDNLEVLREHIPDESVDLVYLDPPFNSQQDFNVLFAEHDGTRSAAQINAFEDTWTWDDKATATYHETVQEGGNVADALEAFKALLGWSDMLAYLTMMAPRLVELRRKLKKNGSLYLHCDPTASHYLKMLLDAVFRPESYCNEVIWKRTLAHGSSKRFGPVHDVIHFYSKSESYTWTHPKIPHDSTYVDSKFKQIDPSTGRRFQAISLTGAGIRHGESGKQWRGINPTEGRRHWALPRAALERIGCHGGSVQDKLDALDAAGLIYWPEKATGNPRLKWFADDLLGVALPDVWTDIPPLNSQARERLGYPTQKPEALLARIITASTQEGGVVLDPFCGCGTAVASAQALGRRWIGIDITHLAIALIRHRLVSAFGEAIEKSFQVHGEPVDLAGARALALQDRYQFQWWALGRIGARPDEMKKGADKGIDGRIIFHDDSSGKSKRILVSVKSGKLKPDDVRSLAGVVERDKASIGVLITLEKATQAMKTDAAAAGFYPSPGWNKTYRKVQILTVEGLLDGTERLECPPLADTSRTFKPARRPKGKVDQQGELWA